MEKNSTTDAAPLFSGGAWFDPIEAGLREWIRGFLEGMIEQEAAAALGRNRYQRVAAAGYRNGTRSRRLLGSFGPVEIVVPRARLSAADGTSREWQSAVLPRYARMTRQVEALIASAYLAGTNTRRVKRALQAASWITVDDTGARHAGRNGFCTQIGNDAFTWFGTRASKNRLNFLDLLRAGHGDYVVNEAALAYMRSRSLAGPVLSRLAAEPLTRFADHIAWQAHLQRLGIDELHVTPDPVCIATEGAVWGAVAAHGFLQNAVIVSDDAGQFAVGQHALCWVHAERLVHKLDTFTDLHRAAQERMRELIWWFYADLKAYRTAPTARRRSEMRDRFDRIFHRRTGFGTLDRLLERLHANKPELLMVLDRPEVPLHTNGSERDIRCQVTKRKISGGTRSDAGRDCRDAFLGLMHTCTKLGIAFWDYLGDRLGIIGHPNVPKLPDLIRCRGQPAQLRPGFCPAYGRRPATGSGNARG